MTYVLDTHVLLWWFEERERLSRAQRRVVKRASASQPLLVSDISLWEIATLHELGRLELKLPLRDWLEQATAPPLVELCHITAAVAAEVAALAKTLPRDPADRLIVATAIVHGATLLTRDRRIADAAVVPVID